MLRRDGQRASVDVYWKPCFKKYTLHVIVPEDWIKKENPSRMFGEMGDFR